MVQGLRAPCQRRAQDFDPGLGRPHVPRSTEVRAPQPLSRCSGAWQPLTLGNVEPGLHTESRALPLEGSPGSSQLELAETRRSQDNNNNNKGPSWICSGEEAANRAIRNGRLPSWRDFPDLRPLGVPGGWRAGGARGAGRRVGALAQPSPRLVVCAHVRVSERPSPQEEQGGPIPRIGLCGCRAWAD